MKEQWRQQMQQKMDGYEKPAPELPWDKVDEALAANRRRATMRMVWGRRAAVAALAALVAMGGFVAFRGDDASDDSRTAINEQQTTTPEASGARASSPATTPESINDDQRIAQGAGASSSATGQRLAIAPGAPVSSSATSPESTDDDQRIAVNKQTTEVEQPQENIQPTVSFVDEVAHTPGDSTAQKKTVTMSTMEWSDLAMTSTSDDSRLTANLYIGNALHGAAGHGMSTAASPGKYIYDTPAVPDGVSGYGLSGGEQPKEKVSHHQPFRLGLSLRYRLNDRWSIDGGLAYTRITTDITMETINRKWQTEQRLTYVGIPVSVNYLLWGNRHVAFYAAAGGMAEKMVKGSWQTDNQQITVTIRPLQFSVNGAVGAEYCLTTQFSLYAEPALEYYFDNGSDVPTFYQDKPLHFGLNLGLRWSIK